MTETHSIRFNRDEPQATVCPHAVESLTDAFLALPTSPECDEVRRILARLLDELDSRQVAE